MTPARPLKLKAAPYAYTVYVLTCPAPAGKKWLSRHGYDGEVEDCEGITCMPPDEANIYVWMDPDAKLPDVSHELIHATCAVLYGSDVPFTRANEETIAYLHSHLLGAYLAKTAARRKKVRASEVVGSSADPIAASSDQAAKVAEP